MFIIAPCCFARHAHRLNIPYHKGVDCFPGGTPRPGTCLAPYTALNSQKYTKVHLPSGICRRAGVSAISHLARRVPMIAAKSRRRGTRPAPDLPGAAKLRLSDPLHQRFQPPLRPPFQPPPKRFVRRPRAHTTSCGQPFSCVRRALSSRAARCGKVGVWVEVGVRGQPEAQQAGGMPAPLESWTAAHFFPGGVTGGGHYTGRCPRPER